ncbi:MAG: hypothetical protein LW834_17745 [Cyanobium sp. 49614_E6]|nr:hypothetical protein [Cyanobium sp. 49614_E6]
MPAAPPIAPPAGPPKTDPTTDSKEAAAGALPLCRFLLHAVVLHRLLLLFFPQPGICKPLASLHQCLPCAIQRHSSRAPLRLGQRFAPARKGTAGIAARPESLLIWPHRITFCSCSHAVHAPPRARGRRLSCRRQRQCLHRPWRTTCQRAALAIAPVPLRELRSARRRVGLLGRVTA